jgi:aldehyde dehydrogenase (NAD+)
LVESGTIFHGGQHDRSDRFIAPTVLVNVSPDSPAMQEEIFGPILPISEVSSVTDVIDFVNARPSPLGLYLFSENQSVTEQILNSTTSGDAAVNECTLQPTIHDLPFGGVGSSGMGKYHGEWDSAHTQTRVGFCRTAPTLTLTACATRPTTAIGSCGKSSYHREQLLNIYA